jgi:hypothetical protein
VRVPRLQATGVSAEISRVEEAIPPPPRSDQGWTLRFDAIHSDSIRSARFGKLLIIGQGQGTVGFLKQLRGGPSELFDSEVSFSDADTSLTACSCWATWISPRASAIRATIGTRRPAWPS